MEKNGHEIRRSEKKSSLVFSPFGSALQMPGMMETVLNIG
jgi:hypothetical protein